MNYLWAYIGALSVTLCETQFVSDGGYWPRAWLFVPWGCVTNWLIYKLVTSSPSLLDALVVFSMSTLSLRILFSVFWLRQDIAPGTWVGVALIFTANIIRHVWR